MGLFYKVSPKERLKIKNNILLEFGVPELLKNNFVRAPFSISNYGRNNLGDYTYEFGRIDKNAMLILLTIHLTRGDKYIQVYMNVFNVGNADLNYTMLKNADPMKLYLPPLSKSEMRLRSDSYTFIPIISTTFYPEHKIGCYFSKRGFNRQTRTLSRLIQKDFRNINWFVARWSQLYTANQVTLQ